MEREHPWHYRRATAKHEQWLRNLADLHELTSAWLSDLGPRAAEGGKPSYQITRGVSPEIAENLWMLDSLSGAPIERFLDDTLPDDTLGRLEHTLWAVQAWTLGSLRSRSSEEGPGSGAGAALDSMLEQSSWKAGRRCGSHRWPGSEGRREWVQDLRAVLSALLDSPFNLRPTGESFLVRRSLPHEVSLELRACPHGSHYPEIKPVADVLCKLHTHWMRGFLYSINHRIVVERLATANASVEGSRCQLRWTFLNS